MSPEQQILADFEKWPFRTAMQLRFSTGLPVTELYPALVRLEAQGKVSSEWYEGACGGSRKRVYRLARDAEPRP